MKPRIKGRWIKNGAWVSLMWKCEEDTFWFYNLQLAIKSANILNGANHE